MHIGALGFRIHIRVKGYIPNIAGCAVELARPDGEYFIIPATRIADNIAEVVTVPAMYQRGQFDIPGRYRATLVVEYDGNRHVSRPFNLDVERLEPV